MSGSLEGITVKVTLELTGWFETPIPISAVTAIVGNGVELQQYFSSRVLSDIDGSGKIQPVPGPNGLLDGTLTVDITGNSVFAQFSGQAQPAGFRIKIENLAPIGVAPGTVAMAGQMNGVNIVNAPSYSGQTKVLELNWTTLGFQPGTILNQTVFYDNKLEDAPTAVNDLFAIKVGQTLSGANILSNDSDLDNLGSAFGVVDTLNITQINGQSFTAGEWIDLVQGGQITMTADGKLQFRENGDFSDLARDVSRATSFEYTVSDSAGLTSKATATISVTGVNTAPTLTIPSAKSVNEDADPISLIGISIGDVDNDNQTVTLSVTKGMLSIGTATGVTGDLDGSDGTMTLSGSLSAVNAALANLTYKPNTNITGADTLSIQTKDANATVNGSLAIAINDQQPILSDQQAELNENTANGSQVLPIAVSGDTTGLTFSIVSGNDAGAFSIDPTTGVITVADTTKLDFETSTTFQLVIGVDDEDADTAPNSQEGLVISLKDINERPTDLSIDRTTIAQSAASTAAAIGTLSSTDPDANDSFAYALVTGAGDTNNDLFQVDGSVLKAQAALAAGTYTIRVRTTDAGNLTLEKQLAITVTDDVGPIIQRVSAADTAFKIGDVMTVTIQAGEAGLLLESGTVNGKALANFTDKGDGTYTATYTIAEGDPERAAGDSIPVQLSLKDQAGNISASFTSAIVNAHDAIDSVRPTAGVPALSSASDTGLSASDGVTSATQQEFRGTGEDGVRVELVEGQTVLATTTIAGGTWTAFLSLAEGQHNLNAVYTDPAGNAALSSPVTVIVDRTAPAAVDDTGTADLRTASTTTANALSNDSDALRVVAVSGAAANIGAPVTGSSGGVFTFAADGTVSFDPGQSFAALASGQTLQTDIALTVSDLAGNEASSTYTVTVTGKNDAPILQTKAPLSLTASTTSIITASLLKATDADDTASELHYTLTSGPAEGMLKLAGVDIPVGGTFTQADIDNGHLQFVAGTTAGAQSFVFSVADGGEDGAAAISAQTFEIAVNPAVVTPPPPVTPPVVIGEVEVTTSTGSDANGRPTTTTTITPSPTGSGEATSGIPLLGSQSESVVTGTLPANVQLVATGLSNPVPVSDIQTILTQSLPSGINVDASTLLSGINQITGAGAVSNVVVSTLTPTLVSGTTGTSGPISIDGANAASQGAALIIDARGLPPGTLLQLNNVGIAIVSGPVIVTGGSGSNVVIGDSAGQTIILGPSDDVLRGGDGDDIIGSKDGNDLLYGDGGNDTVFGGTGNDRLDGGAGNDILRGDEGTDIARFHVNIADAKITRNADGSLTVQHLEGDGGIDTVSTFELLQFNDTVMVTHTIKPGSGLNLSNATKEKEYLAHNPDVAKAVASGQIASGAEHWQKWGKAEGRSYDKPAVDAALFDEAFYLQQNPDVAAAVASGKVASALDHYLAFGLKEGRDASALFDASWYLSKNVDVAAAVTAGMVGSALEHYALFGWKEGRAASAYFDGARYLTDNPDVAAAGMDPLIHYQMYGQAEGRSFAVADQGLWLV